jgi:hypothetical protein
MQSAMKKACPSREGVRRDCVNNSLPSVFKPGRFLWRVAASGGRTFRRPVAISTAPITPTRAAPIEPCRDSSTTEGIQIQPTALLSAKRLKEDEELIRDGAQKNQVTAKPDRTAAET